PYVIYGGIRFYERAEVKDALCYLRMVTTADDLALQRILNKPKRGIGNKTMDTLAAKARETGKTMYETLKEDKIFSGKTQATLNAFVDMVEKWRMAAVQENTEMFRLFEQIIEDSGYKQMLEENKETDRIENLKELIDDVKEFSENYPESNLEEYLQLVSLYGDRDETLESDYVQLMTVHAAKGLEFDTVFVSDMNEGIFPNERAMNEVHRGVEEERRLAYVAFTRAKNKLYLTEAAGFSYILQRVRTRSRFIDEIDDAYIEHKGAIFEENTKKEKTLNPALFNDHGGSFGDRLSKTDIPQFVKGEQIVHSVFGEGIVLSCKNGIVEAAFAYPHGIKKIAAGHPSIKRKMMN
ncbi:MAG: ATP-binding domain-containing protein, partial [Solobacterium sp.]|nr:ATP-binding domain-containing protein [Solobacterium sp.]